MPPQKWGGSFNLKDIMILPVILYKTREVYKVCKTEADYKLWSNNGYGKSWIETKVKAEVKAPKKVVKKAIKKKKV